MSTTVMWILVIILLIVVGVGIGAFILKSRNANRLNDLEEKKEELFDQPVQDEINAVKKMHLVGISQNIFREWNQKWIDLESNSFAELEKHIFEAESLNNSYKLVQAKNEIDDCESQYELMKKEEDDIREAIAELAEQEKKNSSQIQESLDLYESLRNEITENSEAYGQTIDEIETQLDNIENEFTEFVTLNTTGDPIEASDVLETAEEHTVALGNLTKRIPEIIKTVDEKFPRQLSELEAGDAKFKEEGYKLPEGVDFDKSISDIKERMKSIIDSAKRFELDSADADISLTEDEIKDLYDVFEKEYAAHQELERNLGLVQDFIEHTRENNKNLLLEIDHISQSYVLTANEMGQVRNYQGQLEEANKEADALEIDIENNTEANSVLSHRLEGIKNLLVDIENRQISISEGLSGLKVQEKKAQEKADLYDIELRTIKRYVEKLNLPGLPKEYLDLFYMSTSRVENLFKELNKVRVNVETINNLLEISDEDMNVLEDATDSITDDANLSEQLLQYANRYKTTNEDVAAAFNKSAQLFDEDYAYGQSREVISDALNKVEPDAVTRITNYYYNHKETPDYKEFRKKEIS